MARKHGQSFVQRQGALPLALLRQAWRSGGLSPAAVRSLAQDSRQGAQALYQQICRAEAFAAAERRRLDNMLTHERALWRAGHTFVVGVDEVGVGPLAGPVVAAAVAFCPSRPPKISGLDDSKKVPKARHGDLVASIRAQALAVAVGEASPREIDTLNIFAATRLAATRAVAALGQVPHHLLLDAHPLPALACPQTPIVGGDGASQSIAAASLVAKVHRDAWMQHMDEEHPGYGFAEHVGYGTPAHLVALARLGPSPLHRQSFAPVRAATAMRQGAAR